MAIDVSLPALQPRLNPLLSSLRRWLTPAGIAFEEAASVFRDTLSVTIGDPRHSTEEDRFVTMGRSGRNKTLVVVPSEVADTIRIISARLATRQERRKYEERTF